MPTPSFATLEARYGLAGAREEFEHLVAQLVRLEHDDAREVRVSQGDGGLDVLVGATTHEAKVWQAKFFFPTFETKQRAQVTSSLEKAIETVTTHGGTLRQWTLCLPVDLTKENEKWWANLMDANSSIDMRLWGLTELSHRLQRGEGRDVYHASFEVARADADMSVAPPTTVTGADPYDLGVAAAAGSGGLPVYITRDIDGELREWLRREPFVIVQGSSAAGKTRTLLEAARREFPDYEIAAPEAAAVQALPARIRRLRRVDYSAGLVLWLDDLHEYVGPGGIHSSVLDALIADGARILATVRLERSKEIVQTGGRGAAVIDRARVVRLESRASPTERRAFRVRYRSALDSAGIGEHFVAARRLQDRYLNASDDALALARMVIDWRRVTSAKYLAKQRARTVFQRSRERSFDEALTEASTAEHPGDAIVLVHDAALSAPDYLVDLDDRRVPSGARRREVPPEHWSAFLDLAGPDEAATLAQAAAARDAHGIFGPALQVARGSQSPAVRAWALIELGRAVAENDPDQATELWLAALSEKDPDGVAHSADLLMKHADSQLEDLDEETIDRIRDAIFDTHDTRRHAEFAVILSRIYELRGDLDTLADLYKTATDANVAEIGLVYGRALYRAGYSELCGEILNATLEHATESVRGHALVMLANLELDHVETDPTRVDELLDTVIEAFDLAGDEIADDLNVLARVFDRRGLLDDVMRRLADMGDVSAQLHTLLSTPADPEP